jgi:hypothetical protein
MPPENRVGRHDRPNLPERAPPDPIPTNRQPTALVIGQPETSALQLLSENAILFNQVRHGVLLASIQPAKHRRDYQAERACVEEKRS